MESVVKVLQSIAKRCDFHSPEITITPDSNAGDGFLGVYHYAKIKTDDKTLDLFLKVNRKLGINDEFKATLREVYMNEILFYNTIYPEFVKFEREKGFMETFKSVPKCYKTISEEGNEMIVLSNLQEQGFEQHERKVTMDDEHIKITLEEVAYFHALSFALKDQDDQKFKNITEKLIPICITTAQDEFNDTLEYISQYALETLDPIEDIEVYETFKEFTCNLREFIDSIDDLTGNHVVITHGDVHNNNLLYNYEDKCNITCPTSVRFLDWQLLRITTPVLDTATFFYSSCNGLQMENINHFLRIYYDRLSRHVLRLGSDPEKLYPYKLFLNQWRTLARYGLVLSFLIIKILLTDAEEIREKKEAVSGVKTMRETFSYELNDPNEYKTRMKALIYHFVRHGLLEPLKSLL